MKAGALYRLPPALSTLGSGRAAGGIRRAGKSLADARVAEA